MFNKKEMSSYDKIINTIGKDVFGKTSKKELKKFTKNAKTAVRDTAVAATGAAVTGILFLGGKWVVVATKDAVANLRYGKLKKDVEKAVKELSTKIGRPLSTSEGQMFFDMIEHGLPVDHAVEKFMDLFNQIQNEVSVEEEVSTSSEVQEEN